MNGKKIRLCIGKLPAGAGPFVVSVFLAYIQPPCPGESFESLFHILFLRPFHRFFLRLGRIKMICFLDADGWLFSQFLDRPILLIAAGGASVFSRARWAR